MSKHEQLDAIEKAITKFAERLKQRLEDKTENVYPGGDGYWHTITSLVDDVQNEILKNTLHEFLNSLNNKNQGDN